APGRPALYATTRQFLDDLGLASIDQLPLMETPQQQEGMLDMLAELPSEVPLLSEAGQGVPEDSGQAQATVTQASAGMNEEEQG
ncbi:hypothetical protein ACQV5M_22090, partial [Leptospira sp. SA-E8]